MSGRPIEIDRVLAETFVARAEYHDILGSTNDRARQCAADGPGCLPLLVVARRQTAGRGRGSHRWWTGRESLAFSLLVDPLLPQADFVGAPPLVGLAAAVAVVETVSPLLSPPSVGVHWPNDVMAAGRKLAGVLVEVLPDGRQVIGIGVNTNNTAAEAPPELQAGLVTLRDLTHRTHDQTELLIALLRQLQWTLAVLAEDPSRLAAQADRLCLQRGQRLRLQQGSRVFSGLCRGILPDGSVLLETPRGPRAFHTGTLCPTSNHSVAHKSTSAE